MSHCHSVPVCRGLDVYIPVSRYNCHYWAEKWTYIQHLLRLSEFVRVNNELLMMLWVFYLTSNNTKQEEKKWYPLWKAVIVSRCGKQSSYCCWSDWWFVDVKKDQCFVVFGVFCYYCIQCDFLKIVFISHKENIVLFFSLAVSVDGLWSLAFGVNSLNSCATFSKNTIICKTPAIQVI